jgi:hypothetical protein
MRLFDESNEKGATNLRRTKKVSQNDDVEKKFSRKFISPEILT